MNNFKQIWWVLGSFLLMIFSTQVSLAQTFKVNKSASNMKIEGSSNVHDWEEEVGDFQGTLAAELENGQLVKINQLDFTVIAESIKSEHSAMDKNTYKALETKKNPKITFQLDKVNNIDCTSGSKCKVVTSGYLTIAGTKKQVELIFDATVKGDKIVLSGSKSLKMSEYKIEAPTAMFGAITTDDEVKINFNTVFTK